MRQMSKGICAWRVAAFLLLLLSACAPQPILQEPRLAEHPEEQLQDKAIVIVAADLREQTSLRDIGAVGDVLFRRIDDRYATRSPNDYDFGILGSVKADWGAVLGGEDENRAPHIFAVALGTYVLEKINLGSNPTTPTAGYDPVSGAVAMGSFSVKAGEVANLGRLVVHMHWYEGYFYAETHDDGDEVRRLLAAKYPTLLPRLQTKLLVVVSKFRFVLGPPRA